ncbi:DUF1223 domain-containing protein [Shewanella aquimarina]|uniref:DUF1223 domain-containing protein n=1 Tax=Shewanella aquimarina TaxID=260365 RepID=UPI002014E606|nr:DUF1223 domain-containing protein [Shewanella aquimarina]
MPSKLALLLLLSLFTQPLLAAQTQTQFHKRSGELQPLVIELFTSQGCSSCPPMDRWLSGFKRETGLWRDYFPLAFHVTYWNYLGWRDPFSRRAFSRRQYDYLNHKGISQVYTPQLVINGREWRPGGQGLLPDEAVMRPLVGKLSVTIAGQAVTATFDSQLPSNEGLSLHLALLGSGMATQVGRGENRGKYLREDFVVLSHQHFRGIDATPVSFLGTLGALPGEAREAKRLAWVAWVEQDYLPLQAVGDWLENEPIDE